jgi:hypothetical protein
MSDVRHDSDLCESTYGEHKCLLRLDHETPHQCCDVSWMYELEPEPLSQYVKVSLLREDAIWYAQWGARHPGSIYARLGLACATALDTQ